MHLERDHRTDEQKRDSGLQVCPVCMRFFVLPVNPVTPIEREAWITGICSDVCWHLVVGLEN